jgi:hypothetical protein
MIVRVGQHKDAEWHRHLEFSHKGHNGSQRLLRIFRRVPWWAVV